MKTFASATAFALATTTASFAVDIYMLDASHSQVTFNYSHLGFSTTYGMFSGSEGEISYDDADPAASTVTVVTVSMPVKSILTG